MCAIFGTAGIANLKLIETAEYLGEIVDTDSVEWIIYNICFSIANSLFSNVSNI